MENTRNIVLAILLCAGVVLGWTWLEPQIFPPKPKPAPPPPAEAVRDAVALVTGGAEAAREIQPPPKEEAKAEPKTEPKTEPPAIKPIETPPANADLIALGHGDDPNNPYYLRVLLNSQGASVQQIVLTQFREGTREGLAATNPDGSPRLLHLLPGVVRRRTEYMSQQPEFPWPEIHEGPVTPDVRAVLAAPSFVLFHYDSPADERPVNTLGARVWKMVSNTTTPEGDRQEVVFETELGAPHHVKLRKIFSLGRKDYHIGLRVEIARADGAKGAPGFRYQISGGHGLPIEGEWYTSTYRNAMVGWSDARGNVSRYIDDAATIRRTEGSDPQVRTDKAIQYAAVAIQYFASALVVDNEQVQGQPTNFVERVRATPEGPTHKDKPFLDDLTVRAVTDKLELAAPVTHQYLLYHGPVKVRLLKELRGPDGNPAVDPGLVDRYLYTLHLNTLTDYRSPGPFGAFANAIFWSDLVIAFTNLIHGLLWALYQIVPSLGICILLTTILVRGLLFPLSRKQAIANQRLQTQMARLAPEIKKLQEKHKDDFRTFNQEKTRLMLRNGVNPLAAMGGCLLLLCQMPIFMGLYYALQESIFFRLEPFLWMPNLAAPDMLLRWGEHIPFLSTPENEGGMFYLGPYFNILPIVAIGLMMYQQSKMMPPPTDEQQAMQQKMMKWMMIIFAVLFYKVAAGLCVYFIATTLWGVAERRLIPKAHPGPAAEAALSEPPPSRGGRERAREQVPEGKPGLRARLRAWWKNVLEQAQKQSEYRNEQRQGPRAESPPGEQPQQQQRGPGPQRGGKKKRKR